MLQDRCYVIKDEYLRIRDFSLEDFKVLACEQEEFVSSIFIIICSGADTYKVNYEKLQMHVFHQSNPSDISKSLMVFHTDQPKMGLPPLKAFVELMISMKVHHAIIVLKDDASPFVRKVIRELEASGKTVQLFERYELGVNITEHSLVPKHEVLSSEQKLALLQRYKLKENQLPRIQSSDPISRYFGLKRGQVVKITRNSETAGRYITYRICI